MHQFKMLKANVTVMVSDIARHLDHFVEVESADLTIVLHPRRQTMRGPSSDNLSIGLQVPDLMAATRELTLKGLSFTYQENEANRLACFGDPDGTPIYLLEVKGARREPAANPDA
jgi:hypothetical protein